MSKSRQRPAARSRPAETRNSPDGSESRRRLPPGLPRWKKLSFALLTAIVILVVVELALRALGVSPAYDRRDPYAGFTPQVPHFQVEEDWRRSGGRHARPEQAGVAQRPALSPAQAGGHLPDRLPGRLGHLRPAVLRPHLVRRLAPRVPAQGRSLPEMGGDQRRGDQLRQLPDQGTDGRTGSLRARPLHRLHRGERVPRAADLRRRLRDARLGPERRRPGQPAADHDGHPARARAGRAAQAGRPGARPRESTTRSCGFRSMRWARKPTPATRLSSSRCWPTTRPA